MELSKRLLSIAEMLKFEYLIDVGTDHCYIPIYAIKNGLVKEAVAGDLNQGPLQKAVENAVNHNVEHKIQMRLGNGLKIVQDHERRGWCAVIAGMGGLLINSILDEDKGKVGLFSQLLLQPQSDIPMVRKKVHELGLKITDEKIIFEAGKYYSIISCETGEDEEYSEKDYILGRINIIKKEETFFEYIKGELKKGEMILQHIKENNALSQANKQRLQEVNKMIEIYRGVLHTND